MNSNHRRVIVGLKFKSVWFECWYCEVLSINETTGKASVRINRSEQHSHEEEWNLEYTEWGFQTGQYKVIPEPL